MDEKVQQLVNLTMTELSAICHELRCKGFDANLWVRDHGDHYTAEIRIRIPPLGVPIEYVSDRQA